MKSPDLEFERNKDILRACTENHHKQLSDGSIPKEIQIWQFPQNFTPYTKADTSTECRGRKDHTQKYCLHHG